MIASATGQDAQRTWSLRFHRGSRAGGGWRRLWGGRGEIRGEARNPAGEPLKARAGHHIIRI